MSLHRAVVVATDFSDITGALVARAVAQAKAFGVPVHIVHIYAPEPEFVGYAPYVYPGIDEREHELVQEKAELRELVDRVREQGVEADGFMKEGQIVDGILEFAAERDCPLIVVGTHGRNFIKRVLLGSVAEGVIRKSHVPVLVVPPPDRPAETEGD